MFGAHNANSPSLKTATSAFSSKSVDVGLKDGVQSCCNGDAFSLDASTPDNFLGDATEVTPFERLCDRRTHTGLLLNLPTQRCS